MRPTPHELAIALDEALDRRRPENLTSFELSIALDEALNRRRRKPRKTSIPRMVAAAEKVGKSVSSVTLPDGTTLRFGEPAPAEAGNPWLADLKVTKQ